MKATYRFMPGLLLALMAPAAMADQTGWYLGATAGVSDYSSVFASARTLYKQETGFTIVGSAWNPGWSFVGGYRFNRYFSLEAQDFDMGSNNGDLCPSCPITRCRRSSSWKASAWMRWWLTPSATQSIVYAKAGLITSSLEEVIGEVPGQGRRNSSSWTRPRPTRATTPAPDCSSISLRPGACAWVITNTAMSAIARPSAAAM